MYLVAPVPGGSSTQIMHASTALIRAYRACKTPTGAWRSANYSRRPGDGRQNTRAETASTSAARISTHALSSRPAEVLSRAAEGRTAALPSRHEHSAVSEARCALLYQGVETDKRPMP